VRFEHDPVYRRNEVKSTAGVSHDKEIAQLLPLVPVLKENHTAVSEVMKLLKQVFALILIGAEQV